MPALKVLIVCFFVACDVGALASNGSNTSNESNTSNASNASNATDGNNASNASNATDGNNSSNTSNVSDTTGHNSTSESNETTNATSNVTTTTTTTTTTDDKSNGSSNGTTNSNTSGNNTNTSTYVGTTTSTTTKVPLQAATLPAVALNANTTMSAEMVAWTNSQQVYQTKAKNGFVKQNTLYKAMNLQENQKFDILKQVAHTFGVFVMTTTTTATTTMPTATTTTAPTAAANTSSANSSATTTGNGTSSNATTTGNATGTATNNTASATHDTSTTNNDTANGTGTTNNDTANGTNNDTANGTRRMLLEADAAEVLLGHGRALSEETKVTYSFVVTIPADVLEEIAMDPAAAQAFQDLAKGTEAAAAAYNNVIGEIVEQALVETAATAPDDKKAALEAEITHVKKLKSSFKILTQTPMSNATGSPLSQFEARREQIVATQPTVKPSTSYATASSWSWQVVVLMVCSSLLFVS